LLNVKFWRQKGGLTGAFWEDYLQDKDLVMWEDSGKDSGILAAIEWRRAVEMTQKEVKKFPKSDFYEISYEEYMNQPHKILSQLCEKTGLKDDSAIHDFVDRGASLKNMNEKYKQDYTDEYIARLEQAMQPALRDSGYDN